MNRPKIVEDFMRQTDTFYCGSEIDDALRKHIAILESQLPPEPEEEVEMLWRKTKSSDGTYLSICPIGMLWQSKHYRLTEPIVDEILRCRSIAKRVIDWEKFDKELTDKLGYCHGSLLDLVRSLIEAQLKGE